MGLIRLIVDLYIFLIILDVIFSYIPQFKHHSWAVSIHSLVELSCAPVRKFMNSNFSLNLPLDVSPLIVILLFKILVFIF